MKITRDGVARTKERAMHHARSQIVDWLVKNKKARVGPFRVLSCKQNLDGSWLVTMEQEIEENTNL